VGDPDSEELFEDDIWSLADEWSIFGDPKPDNPNFAVGLESADKRQALFRAVRFRRFVWQPVAAVAAGDKRESEHDGEHAARHRAKDGPAGRRVYDFGFGENVIY